MTQGLCAPGFDQGGAYKGEPKWVLTNVTDARLSDKSVDVRLYNAVNVLLYFAGSGSITVTVKGGVEEGSSNYLRLPDEVSQKVVTESTCIEVICGAPWAKLETSDIVGSPSITAVVTAFRSPGATQVTVTNTAAQNLAQYNSVAVGPTNPIDVRETEGDYTTPTPGTITVGVASGVALAANTSRTYALLVNDSDTDIYLKLGGTAVVNAGIRLNALGGSYEMSKQLGNLYTGVVNAICASASKTLLVTEGA